MKIRIISCLLVIFINSNKLYSQEILSVELCNKTQSYFYFGNSTSDIKDFLLQGNTTLLSFINFSKQSKLNTKYLLALSRKFDSVFKKYNQKELPMSLNKEVNLTSGLWHEVNYFYYDKKTKMPSQIMQITVWFEGNDPEKEKMQPKITDIKIRVGKEIIDRKKYLMNLDFSKEPPPLDILN